MKIVTVFRLLDILLRNPFFNAQNPSQCRDVYYGYSCGYSCSICKDESSLSLEVVGKYIMCHMYYHMSYVFHRQENFLCCSDVITVR